MRPILFVVVTVLIGSGHSNTGKLVRKTRALGAICGTNRVLCRYSDLSGCPLSPDFSFAVDCRGGCCYYLQEFCHTSETCWYVFLRNLRRARILKKLADDRKAAAAKRAEEERKAAEERKAEEERKAAETRKSEEERSA
ncbi:uncharacterized protein LOC131951778 [Physella acuta]|uniref:uncharacterized protein LOC131951778 n=1 Tax=Physella acuta TaxID=109671 RepID=UPI0027DE5BC1|nr:uncharacterized protein LOC131951778 [Physella acuta]